MKYYRSAARYFGAFVLIVLFTASAYSQGFLKANGRLIVDGKGNKVILRGMGMGGWMLQEGYMFKLSNLGRQYIIRQHIEDVAGAEYTANFYDKWLTNHTRKIDVDSMAAWGFNSIRLPMHYNLYTLPVDKEPVAGKNTWVEKGFAMTDSLVKWCKAAHIYLILDLHAAPGGQGNDLPISDRDPDKPSLWESKANQDKMIALWKKLAQRYANEPAIGGYDIINEPNWGFESADDKRGTSETKNEPLRKLMMDITTAIREVDKNHIVIVEGNGFGNNYRGVFPLWDNNMVVSFHKYGNFNNVKAIQSFLTLSEQYNVPLWLGESGENSDTWFTEAIKLAESNNIGWAWWQLKKMGIANPLEIKVPAGYQKLVDYWSGKGAKPSQGEAIATLNELLENIKLENNIYHKDITDAMFRQVRSATAIPFKRNFIGSNTTINAVDYDMGSQRIAYFDKDTASYQYTPGVKTVGNKGHAYRNEGVDIQADESGYHIFSIEDSEWLQYTVQAGKGTYTVKLLVSSEGGKGKVSLSVNNNPAQAVSLAAATPIAGWYPVELKDIKLNKGINKLRVLADEGGFNLKSIQFIKD
ncbi:cellulase family glycosylhydrolase [Mucilaginibacter sp.]|uniref:cellulase family glycosylhydrolase n=1 Tax=Mucilaginibacter sp. TaxID=1882438 RepID=UPI00262DEC1F|nr:cellulase family glycosylhydrolase [Mucilaginibacter sp.]MDB4925071.1 glycosyl hydrolase family 5 [Mucilaginibacter sp.]